MSSAYRLAPRAQQDIEDLVDFIAADDLEVALRIEQELYDAFDLLASRPFIGHTRTDLAIPAHLRVWPFYSYLIVYRPDTSPLEVVRVWHGAQDKPSPLKNPAPPKGAPPITLASSPA